MNILDHRYPDITFKTDVDDVRVIIQYLDSFSEILQLRKDVKTKVYIILVQEIRDKLLMKEIHKKGVHKKFLIKCKAYHALTLVEAFTFNEKINCHKPFEKNCIQMYSDLLHEKLIGL